jgi:hypothetical protein
MVVTRRQAASAEGIKAAPAVAPSPEERDAHKSPSLELGVPPNGKEANIESKEATTPTWVLVLLVLFAVITYVTYPVPFQPHGEPTLRHVFFYGWMTAISTGLGVLPFMVLQQVGKYWVGISNGTSFSWLLESFIPVAAADSHDRISFCLLPVQQLPLE